MKKQKIIKKMKKKPDNFLPSGKSEGKIFETIFQIFFEIIVSIKGLRTFVLKILVPFFPALEIAKSCIFSSSSEISNFLIISVSGKAFLKEKR